MVIGVIIAGVLIAGAYIFGEIKLHQGQQSFLQTVKDSAPTGGGASTVSVIVNRVLSVNMTVILVIAILAIVVIFIFKRANQPTPIQVVGRYQ